MNKKGFTLLEVITSISLFLMMVSMLWGFAGRFFLAGAELSVRNELFEIADMTERILKRELEYNASPEYIRLTNGQLIKYEDFSEGELKVLFVKEKYYNTSAKDYRESYRAVNIKSDTKKILYQESVDSPFISPSSIGGYDLATQIEKVYLKKQTADMLVFTVQLEKEEIRYEKEIRVYFKNKSKI